jgi:hypothetical protein
VKNWKQLSDSDIFVLSLNHLKTQSDKSFLQVGSTSRPIFSLNFFILNRQNFNRYVLPSSMKKSPFILEAKIELKINIISTNGINRYKRNLPETIG